MTRLPAVRPTEVIAALKRAGFEIQRHKGSHVILRHPIKSRMTVVAVHGGADLPLPTLKAILKQAGLSDDHFRQLL